MIYNERDLREAQALDIAQKMLVAARTAPKGKGIDVLECAVVNGDEKEALAVAMETIGKERGHAFFLRDAGCVRACQCVVLVGTRPKVQSLNVGIALGSAVSRAQAYGVDTRIMFSAGTAAAHLGLLGEGVQQVLAIPVSISSKSPFFDRG